MVQGLVHPRDTREEKIIRQYPWPTLARSEPTRMASASQLRTLNRLRAEALGDLAIGIDASQSDQIDGGALDRVAQIAERKYCRPHARPFRLGLTQVL